MEHREKEGKKEEYILYAASQLKETNKVFKVLYCLKMNSFCQSTNTY